VINSTTKTIISGTWERSPPSSKQMKFMIMNYRWSFDDNITSNFYCYSYEWSWDTNSWVCQPIKIDENPDETRNKYSKYSTYIFPTYEYEQYKKIKPINNIKNKSKLVQNTRFTFS